jgi:hypothetical protein
VGHSDLTTVTDERGGRGTGGLTINRVNPLEYANGIKQLFLAHERPEFAAFFDRAYPDAVAAGATSWVGLDEDGCVRAHIAQFPHEFLFGRRTVRGSLLVNVMVAKQYRTFWPALTLVRRALNDSKQAGSVDFIYTDPNESALAILRAAGFRPVGALRRFVLPLTDGRRSVDLAIRLYHLVGRWRARTPPLVLIEKRAGELEEALERAPSERDVRSLLPVRGVSLYRRRLAGYPGPGDCWYTFHSPDSRDAAIGRTLVRGPDSRGLAVVCVLECEPVTLLSSVLVTLAHRLRHNGAAWLEICVMAESQAASEVRRAGFLPRQERTPVVALPLTALGAEAIAAGSEWRLLPIDLDR